LETTTHPCTPLRQHVVDDMRVRKTAEHTNEDDLRAVRKLAAFLGRSPDTATVADLRRFHLHPVDAGAGPATINATITGLKFFFDITLDQRDLMAKMQHVRVRRTPPVVLSREEAERPIPAAPNLKSTRPRCRWPMAPASHPRSPVQRAVFARGGGAIAR
jgi:hypothetical protein